MENMMDLEIPFKGAPQDTRQSSQVPPKPMPTEDEAPLRRRADKPIAAVEFLRAGLGHMEDRASTYDKPEGERSMGNTVAMFNIATGHTLTEEQGWLFMILLKAVRSQQGNFKADNYEDGAAYFGLMGETGSRDRRNVTHGTLSRASVTAIAIEVQEVCGRTQAKNLINKYGHEKVMDIRVDQFDDFVADCRRAIDAQRTARD